MEEKRPDSDSSVRLVSWSNYSLYVKSNDQVTGMNDTPPKSAVADIDDPMQQLEHIGETTVVPFPCKKRMRKGYTDVVLRVSIAETFGATQLRGVRVLRSQKDSLWIHEEDAPWLVAYVASELATGGVGPMIDPDGSIDDENSQGFPQDGAAVAEFSKGCTAVAELSTYCTCLLYTSPSPRD